MEIRPSTAARSQHGCWNEKNKLVLTYAPIVALASFGAHYVQGGLLSVGDYAVLLLAGYLIWSVLEYVMHRHAFHWYRKAALLAHLTYDIHVLHHKAPGDKSHTTIPKRLSLPIFGLILAACIAGTGRLVHGLLLTASIVTFYVAFEVMHWRSHDDACQDFVTRAVRRYHEHHHYGSNREHFGVISPLCDWLFGTRARARGTGPRREAG